jgi:glycosyltransferase involved in cell wall biosynthesis
MMTDTADLSVVMPTYKHAHCLPRALNALLGQSVRPREVIVVDDASPDDTRAVLESFSHDPALVVIHNDRNRGTNESVRIGTSAATGKYLYCTASDDYVLPGFVEKMVGELERHPQAGLCCAWLSVVNEATGEIRPNRSGWCDEPRYFSPDDLEKFIGHACIPGHATILRRTSFDAAGGFLPDLQWHSDWFLNFVVAFREGMCHVPQMLALLSESPGSYAAAGSRSEREVAAINAIFDRLLASPYEDVLPRFACYGVLSTFGPAVLRAAAGRADRWTRPILSLINCLTTEQYESLAESQEPAVRELAVFFLGTFWREVRERRIAEARRQADVEQTLNLELGRALATVRRQESQLHELEASVLRLSEVVRRMESSYFWRARQMLAHHTPTRLRGKPRLLLSTAVRRFGRLFN